MIAGLPANTVEIDLHRAITISEWLVMTGRAPHESKWCKELLDQRIIDPMADLLFGKR